MTAPDLVALVLAAGAARRFGSDKLMHPLGGKPLAAHIADTLMEMNLTPRLAICPAGANDRIELFEERGFEVIANPEPERGMASSLALGAVRAQSLDAGALLVCLADMPYVTAAHLERIMRAGGDAVATSAAGLATPPVMLHAAFFPALIALTGDHGARQLLANATLVPADLGMIRDIDRPDDLKPAR